MLSQPLGYSQAISFLDAQPTCLAFSPGGENIFGEKAEHRGWGQSSSELLEWGGGRVKGAATGERSSWGCES